MKANNKRRISIIAELFFLLLVSVNSPANGADQSRVIETFQDSNGITGSGFVEYSTLPKMSGKTIFATSVVHGISAHWQAAECDVNSAGCVNLIIYRDTVFTNESKILVPGLKITTIRILYSDGSPIKNAKVDIVSLIDSTCTTNPDSYSGCRWKPALSETVEKFGNTGATTYTDNEGKINLVSVENADIYKANFKLSVLAISDEKTQAVGNSVQDVLLANLLQNKFIAFNLDSPRTTSQKQQALKCQTRQSGNGITQEPKCSLFPSFESNTADDPLPFKENTPNSVIRLNGGIKGKMKNAESATPNTCVNPRIVEDKNYLEKDKVLLFFDTKNRGMCRIYVGEQGFIDVAYIEIPVRDWSGNKPSNIRVSGNELYDHGNLEIGKSIKLSDVKFRVWNDVYSYDRYAPVELNNTTPLNCEQSNILTFTAKSTGECIVEISWPRFSFGGYVFPENKQTYKLFTTKSSTELAAIKKASVEVGKAAQAKRAADAKLCKTDLQNIIRQTYADYKRKYELYNQAQERLDNWTYQARIFPNETVQVPASKYGDVLSLYPSIDGMREVPISSYVAVLSGELVGARIDLAIAYKKAEQLYSKSSAGCRKVMGAP